MILIVNMRGCQWGLMISEFLSKNLPNSGMSRAND